MKEKENQQKKTIQNLKKPKIPTETTKKHTNLNLTKKSNQTTKRY